MLWERSVTEQRYNAVLEVLEAGLPVTEVADRYGVSRQSVHTWIARYRAGGLEGLADRSHRPNRCPHQLAAAVEARVCELRRQHPGWGPQRLRHGLERRGVMPLPSRSVIWRLLVRNRLISPGGPTPQAGVPAVGTCTADGAVAAGPGGDPACRRHRDQGADRGR